MPTHELVQKKILLVVLETDLIIFEIHFQKFISSTSLCDFFANTKQLNLNKLMLIT